MASMGICNTYVLRWLPLEKEQRMVALWLPYDNAKKHIGFTVAPHGTRTQKKHLRQTFATMSELIIHEYGCVGLRVVAKDIPNYFDENQNINQDALEWIDSITSECLNNPVEFKGKKINYISVFEKQCREQSFEEDDED